MGIPVIGDAKGAVHYLIHDKEGGNSAAMKSASRTVGAKEEESLVVLLEAQWGL